MIALLHVFEKNAMYVNLGHRVVSEMTLDHLTARTRHTNMSTGAHPSSSMLYVHGSNSIMSQHICVCLSMSQQNLISLP